MNKPRSADNDNYPSAWAVKKFQLLETDPKKTDYLIIICGVFFLSISVVMNWLL